MSEKKECNDKKCPLHSGLALRGRELTGVVLSARMKNSAIIKISHDTFVPKYKRYEHRSSRIAAHNSPCVAAKEGDYVTLKECRPLSKTKAFAITKVMSHGKASS